MREGESPPERVRVLEKEKHMKKKPATSRPGDSGTTVVPSVGMVRKSDPRVEALGDLDELNCTLGFLALKLRGGARSTVAAIQER